MRVKICGIRNKKDMETALNAGADALGFLVGITHLAEDKINNEEAKQLISSMPPFVSSVAVTHLTSTSEIIELVKYLNPTTVQIHDYIAPEAVKHVRKALPGIKIIKAVHVTGEEAIDTAMSFTPYVDALLLDSRTHDRLGGTGMTHDWNISKKIVKNSIKPVILAGGLNPENVYGSVIKVMPYAVDVNSGVETGGMKDYEKVLKFISEAKRAYKSV